MPGNSVTGARPELLNAIAALRAVIAQEHPSIKWEVADYGGLRTQADTAQILQYRDNDWAAELKRDPTLKLRTTKEAWRPISPWGSSMHNYGAAFDVVITGTPAGMSRLAALNIVKDYADVVGLVDGRNFSHPDPPHFELPGGLAAARLAWEKMTGTKIFSARR
jgi:hypothetical protein